MKSVSRFAVLLLAGVVAMSSIAAMGESDVIIKNDSSWVLTELYLSPADDNEWGPDQLGNHVIGSGDEFTLSEIPCEVYDIRLVDEDDDVCILEGVALCNHEAGWHITNQSLLQCQSSTDE